MNNLGFLFKEQGDFRAAEAWFKRAADNGYPKAVDNLNALRTERGSAESARSQ